MLQNRVQQEQSLMQAARRGDKQAFATIVELHQGAVYGYLRARLLEPADAEDLTQEVLLRCYRGRDKFERASSLRSWLIGVARNVLHEHVRKVTRRKEVAWTELCLELDRLTEADSRGSYEEEALGYLPECVESLGLSAREALELRYQSSLRLAEIGLRLRRSEGAVKLLMHRARQALRNCLDRKLKAEHVE